jgi:hypothetical protein
MENANVANAWAVSLLRREVHRLARYEHVNEEAG